jgi:hypothetical protein
MIEKSFKVGTKMPVFPEESSKIELKTALNAENTILSLSNQLQKTKVDSAFKPINLSYLAKSV